MRLELQKQLFWLVTINVIPHFWNLDLWATFSALLLLVWRGAQLWLALPTMNKWLRAVFVVAFTAVIYSQFSTLMGPEAATPLFVLMVCIKQFEIRSPRDVVVVAFLCFLLLMYKLIESQSIFMTLFLFFDVVLITAFLGMFHTTSKSESLKHMVQRSLKLAGLGLPLLLVLFVSFPRFSAGLWRPEQRQAKVGFDNKIDPGSVAEMAQSDALAFRATFSDFVPSTDQLYWKGAVLARNLGLRWEPGDSYFDYQNIGFQKSLIDPSQQVDYEVILEPHRQKWIFVLDWPLTVSIQEESGFYRPRMKQGRSVVSSATIYKRLKYQGQASLFSSSKLWGSPDLSRYLELPPQRDSAVQALALTLKKDTENARQFAGKILNHFATEKFRYSLKTEKMSKLRDFLFGTRVGFCEHFAGAMANLLRYGGVPSRVIVGFHGGTAGLAGDYVTVRNQDAHAWVEYWSREKKTWLRVDPTSVVAPERLRLGGFAYLNGVSDTSTGEHGLDGAEGGIWSQYYFQAQMVWDMLEMSWVSFLINYDLKRQKELLSQLGFKNVSSQWLTFLALFLTGALLILLYFILWSRRGKESAEARVYKLFKGKLAKKGLPIQNHWGPLTLQDQAIEHWPEAKNELERLSEQLIALRYGADAERPDLKLLKKQIKSLRLAKSG